MIPINLSSYSCHVRGKWIAFDGAISPYYVIIVEGVRVLCTYFQRILQLSYCGDEMVIVGMKWLS